MGKFSFLNKESVLNNLQSQFIEKGGTSAQLGEVRVWSDGKKYQKTMIGWIPYFGSHSHTSKPSGTTTPPKPSKPKNARFDGNLTGLAKYGSPTFAPDLNTHLSTEIQYSSFHSGWKKIRYERTQKPIINSFVSKGKKNPNGQKTVYLMMGAPASGKGTLQSYLRKEGKIPDYVLSVDPDEIKTEALKPDFDRYFDEDKFSAADKVHRESVHISNLIGQSLENEGYDYLEDRVYAVYEVLMTEIQRLDKLGYKVHIMMSKLPFDVGLKRMRERGDSSGRYVPEVYMKSRYDMIDSTWNRLMKNMPKNVLSATQYDTMDKNHIKVLDEYIAK